MQFRPGKRGSLGLIGLVGVVVYVGWMGGPYLRSVILRDAAVTSWINPTTAPIAGFVSLHPLYPGEPPSPMRRFDPRLSIAEVNRRIDALKQALGREIEHADISVLALAVPD